MPNRLIDLTGKRFGRLVVIRRAETDKNKAVRWICLCDCGNTKVVSGPHLRNGDTQSCGCLRRELVGIRSAEIARHVGINNKKHGMRGTRLYNIWQGMKARCLNINSKYYKRYGFRGITICDAWRDSFEAFRDWALANGYRDDLTIDRIDNGGNYCPENCRWITMKEQQNNRRSNRFITYNGKTKTVSQWASEIGVSTGMLYHRLDAGWDIDRAFTEPSQRKNRRELALK